MKITEDAGVLTLDTGIPTVEQALERLAGRRATAIEIAARVRVVTPTVGQCRKTRRGNLKKLRAETKAVRRAAEAKARAAVLEAG